MTQSNLDRIHAYCVRLAYEDSLFHANRYCTHFVLWYHWGRHYD